MLKRQSRSYVSGHGAFERQLENWLWAGITTLLLTAILHISIIWLLALSPLGAAPNQLPIFLLVLFLNVLYLRTSFEKKDPATNSVVLVAGDYWRLILSGGWIWVPKWIAETESTSVVRRTLTVTSGSINGVGDEGSIYSKDKQRVAFEIELVIWIVDPFTWIALYASDPQVLIGDIFDRTIRWFAERFPAEQLVHLKLQMSQALKGELQNIIVNGKTVQLPNFTRQNTIGEVEKTGAYVEDLYVKNVVVSVELEAIWSKIAKEETEQQTQMKDAETGVAISLKWQQTGLDPDEAANMATLVQQREGVTKQIFSVDGIKGVTKALGAVAPFLLGKSPQSRDKNQGPRRIGQNRKKGKPTNK
ncbi:MAG: hypothetical protein JKX80_02630 [Candidatus Pacebacteria bacterium]|nr:hypothetical protein [Candidatus Paceibacterota bacterium]